MSTINVLITGANRGLGRGLTERFLQLPNRTVIAAVRDPKSSSSKALNDLPKAENSILIVLQYDASIYSSAASSIQDLLITYAEIKHLDIVIANAGISKMLPLVREARPEDMLEHYQTNVLGGIALFQATRELLKASVGNRDGIPAFVWMSSGAGSLSEQPPFPNAAYGPTKAAANWYTIRLHAEEEWLTAVSFNPGFVQTDMGTAGAKALGLEEMLITTDQSCNGMIKVIGALNRVGFGGKFVDWTGKENGW